MWKLCPESSQYAATASVSGRRSSRLRSRMTSAKRQRIPASWATGASVPNVRTSRRSGISRIVSIGRGGRRRWTKSTSHPADVKSGTVAAAQTRAARTVQTSLRREGVPYTCGRRTATMPSSATAATIFVSTMQTNSATVTTRNGASPTDAVPSQKSANTERCRLRDGWALRRSSSGSRSMRARAARRRSPAGAAPQSAAGLVPRTTPIPAASETTRNIGSSAAPARKKSSGRNEPSAAFIIGAAVSGSGKPKPSAVRSRRWIGSRCIEIVSGTQVALSPSACESSECVAPWSRNPQTSA